MECPCKSCGERGCGAYHDECPEFLEWKKCEDEKKEQMIGHKKYYGKSYINHSTFKSRSNGVFKSTKKGR